MFGIDISHWQGEINWDVVNANPDLGFVIMKATEGTSFVDARFKENWLGCQKAKAAYHFWRYAADPVTQAAHFHKTVTDAAGAVKVRPVIDLEDTGAPKGGNIYSNLRQFEDAVRAKFNSRIPLIYTAAWWWNPYVGQQLFPDDPLWVAHYTVAGAPTLPTGWSTWKAWQYTSSGSIPGIASKIDMNRWNGTDKEMQDFFYFEGGTVPPSGDWDEARISAIEGSLAELAGRLGDLEEFRDRLHGAFHG